MSHKVHDGTKRLMNCFQVKQQHSIRKDHWTGSLETPGSSEAMVRYICKFTVLFALNKQNSGEKEIITTKYNQDEIVCRSAYKTFGTMKLYYCSELRALTDKD